MSHTRIGAARLCENEQHGEAVIHAEIKRLIRTLSRYRVLRGDALAREAGADVWQQEGFDRALQAAIQAGEIEQLPFGFYRLPHRRRMNGTRPAA
jgi:hypothetical protein